MDEYQAGYRAGVADHGEHHQCPRCYAAGQAAAEARVEELTAERDALETQRDTAAGEVLQWIQQVGQLQRELAHWRKALVLDEINAALDAAGGK